MQGIVQLSIFGELCLRPGVGSCRPVPPIVLPCHASHALFNEPEPGGQEGVNFQVVGRSKPSKQVIRRSTISTWTWFATHTHTYIYIYVYMSTYWHIGGWFWCHPLPLLTSRANIVACHNPDTSWLCFFRWVQCISRSHSGRIIFYNL